VSCGGAEKIVVALYNINHYISVFISVVGFEDFCNSIWKQEPNFKWLNLFDNSMIQCIQMLILSFEASAGSAVETQRVLYGPKDML